MDGSATQSNRRRFGIAAACVAVWFGLGPAAAETIRFLDDDSQAAAARVAAIDAAQRSIDLAVHQVADDEFALGILQSLRQAAGRGVRVRLVVDALHDKTRPEVRRRLLAGGVAIREYHPFCKTCPFRYDHRLHDKLLIVDGGTLIVGGRNLTAGFFGRSCERNYHDRDLVLEGPAVDHAAAYFQALWDSGEVFPDDPGCRGDDAAAERSLAAGAAWLRRSVPAETLPSPVFAVACPVEFVHTHEAVAGPEPDIADVLRGLVDAARCDVLVESPYLVLNDAWERSIVAARRRGVRVTFVTNSLVSTDEPCAYAGYANQKRRLLALGVRLEEYRGGGTLHAKALVADDAAFVGSYNLNPRSESADSESGVVVRDPAFAAALRASIARNQRAFSSCVTRPDRPIDLFGRDRSQPCRSALLPLYRLAAPCVFREL